MKKQIVLSVLSKDRPGIVADITGVIFDLNGDLADLSQTVLDGYFSMIVMAQFDRDISVEKIKQKIDLITSRFPLEVIVKEISLDQSEPFSSSEETYIVTGQGENRTGLVAAMGAFCRENNINIVDYVTKLSGTIYSMILEIDLAKSESPDIIRRRIEAMAEKLGLKIVMHHKKLFQTVNEISSI